MSSKLLGTTKKGIANDFWKVHVWVYTKNNLWIHQKPLKKKSQIPIDIIVIDFTTLKKYLFESTSTNRLEWLKIPFMNIYLAEDS